MAGVAHNLNAAFLSVGKTVKTSSGSAINIAICLATVGSEQLFSFAAFTCPCPQANTTRKVLETVGGNRIYGMVFIIVPAIALFLLGYAMNIRTWKLMTGCWRRSDQAARGYVAGCCTLMEIMMQAAVAPAAWMSIAFLDGKYFACAMSTQPYDMPCDLVSRTAANKIRYTTEYERQRQTSQVLGWIFIIAAMFFGSLVYMAYRWLSPLTYHQRNYMKWYQEIEMKQFEEVAREQITEETKKNAEYFLKHRREKQYWDKIATVFTHTREKGNEVYSRLDQWSENNMPVASTSCVSDDETKPTEENNSKNTTSTDNDGRLSSLDIGGSEEAADELLPLTNDKARLVNSKSVSPHPEPDFFSSKRQSTVC